MRATGTPRRPSGKPRWLSPSPMGGSHATRASSKIAPDAESRQVGCTDPEHAGGRARSYYMPMDRRPRDLSLTTARGSAGGEEDPERRMSSGETDPMGNTRRADGLYICLPCWLSCKYDK